MKYKKSSMSIFILTFLFYILSWAQAHPIAYSDHKIVRHDILRSQAKTKKGIEKFEVKIDVSVAFIKIQYRAKKEVEEKINRDLKNIIAIACKEFLYIDKFSAKELTANNMENCADLLVKDLKGQAEGNYFAWPGVMYDIEQKVLYNKNDILTVAVIVEKFTGGPHGLGLRRYYNYDLKTGNLISIQSLVKENSLAIL